jgi:hypothetical protein
VVAACIQDGVAEGLLLLNWTAQSARVTVAYINECWLDEAAVEDGRPQLQRVLDELVDERQPLVGPFKALGERVREGWETSHRPSDGQLQGTGARLETVMTLRGAQPEDIPVDEDEESSGVEEGPPIRVALLVDALRVFAAVVDGHMQQCAQSTAGLLAFDGQALFNWFRALIVFYQTCFLRVLRCLRNSPGSVVPYSIILWHVYVRDYVLLTVLGGHAVAKPRNRTSDLGIALGLHKVADTRHGMLNMSYGCIIEAADSPFRGCMALNMNNDRVTEAVQKCPQLPFVSALEKASQAIKAWAKTHAYVLPVDFGPEVEQSIGRYRASIGGKLWGKESPSRSPGDMPDEWLTSAEALMGVTKRPAQTWGLLSTVESPIQLDRIEVVLPWYVREWVKQKLAQARPARRGVEERAADHVASTEVLVEEVAAVAGQVAEEGAAFLDVARLLIESTAMGYFQYALGQWESMPDGTKGGRGTQPGRQAMQVAEAVKALWLAEENFPYGCIFTKEFWVKASAESRGKPKQHFGVPHGTRDGNRMYHLSMALLKMLESRIWQGTTAAVMLNNALSGSEEERALQKVALATAMKGVFRRRFPVGTVFAVHAMSNEKFTGAGRFWVF